MENGTDETKSGGRKPADFNMAGFMDDEAASTGVDIKAGQYPARFVKFGEPFMLDGKFKEQLVVDLIYAVRLKDGEIGIVKQLVNMPPNAKAINVRSNMFKALKAIAPALIESDGKKIKKGTKISAFCGHQCQVTVAVNDRDWPFVEAVSSEVEGLKYPTAEEAKTAAEGSQDVPF